MGPRAREKLVQEAMAAGFRLEGDSDEDFVRRVLDKLAAPAVEAVTDASGAALKEARTALLEAAGSATTINSRVAEAKTKFQGRLLPGARCSGRDSRAILLLGLAAVPGAAARAGAGQDGGGDG